MDSYEQTLDYYREAVSLGFSANQVISDLEDDENTSIEALREIKAIRLFGY